MTLEKHIEWAVCRYAKSLGWRVYKFVSPAHRSVPDRIFLREGRVFMIEFKAPGKVATKAQLREIKRIIQESIPVYVCDNVTLGKEIVAFQSGLQTGVDRADTE